MIEGSAREPAILVSACLLGVQCNHLGRHNLAPDVVALAGEHRLVPVCPESLGGLPTPRPAASRRPDGRIVTNADEDVSGAFARGAAATVRIAQALNATRAVLKARSPSCDCREGLTALALKDVGVTVESEEDVEARTIGGNAGA